MRVEECPKCGSKLTTLSSSGRKFCSTCKWTENKETQVKFSQSQSENKSLKSSKNNNLERIIIVIVTIIVTTIIVKFISPSNADKLIPQIAKEQAPQKPSLDETPETTSDNHQVKTINSTEEKTEAEVSNSPELLDEKLEAKSKTIAIKYLDDITKKGSSGYGYWCQSSQELLSSLYAPRSYQILDEFESNSSASYTVRIESSTKGGFPVISNWGLYMKEEGNNWCIALLSEQK